MLFIVLSSAGCSLWDELCTAKDISQIWWLRQHQDLVKQLHCSSSITAVYMDDAYPTWVTFPPQMNNITSTNPMNVLLRLFLELVQLKSQPVGLVEFCLFAIIHNTTRYFQSSRQISNTAMKSGTWYHVSSTFKTITIMFSLTSLIFRVTPW